MSGCQLAHASSAHFSAPNCHCREPKVPFIHPAHVSQHLCFPGEWGSSEVDARKGSACMGEGRRPEDLQNVYFSETVSVCLLVCMRVHLCVRVCLRMSVCACGRAAMDECSGCALCNSRKCHLCRPQRDWHVPKLHSAV